MTTDPSPALFIPLAQGLGVSGVVTWAIDLANAMAGRAWRVAIALHPETPGYAPIEPALHPGVGLHDLRHLPAFGTTGVDLSLVTRAYRDILDGLGWSPASPVLMLPTLEADCFGAAAALAASNADRLRLIGWQHSDTAFDAALMRTYEPALHRLVAVSDLIAVTLGDALPHRLSDVATIPCGVHPLDAVPARAPDATLEIVYTGRIEHEQKRVGALADLARRLTDRGVAFGLTLIGDGPASDEIDAALARFPTARRQLPTDRDGVRRVLAESDLFVLPSRYEGLSLSMLEAMACACAPVVTRVRSGAAQAITDGHDGLLIYASSNDPPALVGERLADAIAPLAGDRGRLDRLRAGALATARQRFSHVLHADRCEALFGAVLSEPPRPWPLDRPCAFSSAHAPAATNGTVPPDAAQRARAALRAFAEQHPGERLAVYGCGRHTLAIAAPLAEFAHLIDCVADDDPRRHAGTLWGWEIVPLSELAPRGLRHVLVSSWIHAGTMGERARDAALRPITIYPTPTPAPV